MLHEPKELLLNDYLLLLHGLLLLLKLILACLHLSNGSYYLLCLMSLVMPHALKYSQQGRVYL